MAISRAVVTGASGHLGNTLVRHLVERGVPTRALLHSTQDQALDGLDIERAHADLADVSTLERAFSGADVVFHVAGLVSITSGQEARLTRINVEGTTNVLAACRKMGVRRLVYTSSVHALVEPSGPGVLDESAGFDPTRAFGAYGISKATASKQVQDAGRSGALDTVLVLPTGCMGPHDFRLSELGSFIARVGQRRMPVSIEGGYDFVDVRDVAQGTLAAAERGRSGEAYLLGGRWASTRELAALVARAARAPTPWFTLPLWLASLIAHLGPPWERLTGRRALLTPYSVHTLAAPYRISHDKAARELSFTARPLEETVADAWTWLSTHPSSPLQRRLTLGPGRAPT